MTEGGESFIRRSKPTSPIPPSASAVHGIQDQDVASAPSFKIVIEEFFGYLRRLGSPVIVLVGHNAKVYDDVLLAASICRSHGTVEGLQNSHLQGVTLLAADTLVAARRAKKLKAIDCPTLRLGDLLRSLCKKELIGAHTALPDAQAALDIVAPLRDHIFVSRWREQAVASLRARRDRKRQRAGLEPNKQAEEVAQETDQSAESKGQ